MTAGVNVSDSLGRRELADAVAEFERACAQETLTEPLAYLDMYALEIWFGISPNKLRAMLYDLMSRGAPTDSVAAGMYAFLTGTEAPESVHSTIQGEAVLPEAELFSRMMDLRMRGRTAQAAMVAVDIAAKRVDVQSTFDRQGGWNLFLSVQLGTTAMLSGELAQALLHFAEARMHPPAPVLRFLLREACAKAALVEACEGDPQLAREYITQAAAIERTTSWSEPGVDAVVAVTRALLEPDQAAAETILEATPLGQIGEMWPYYAIARTRVLSARGGYAESERLLALLDGMALARTVGEGYSGSILALLSANLLLGHDNAPAAQVRLETVDPRLVRSQLGLAALSLKVGKPRQALQRVLEIPERDLVLRQLALWRFAVLAAAHLRLDEREEARVALQYAGKLPGGLTPSDTQQFDPQVREFARTHLPSWPEEVETAPATTFARATSATGRHLTEREVEVLQLLARGHTREEIAGIQFISLNTLKTQLRSVYRKLGVSQRSAAVLAAQRRGLV